MNHFIPRIALFLVLIFTGFISGLSQDLYLAPGNPGIVSFLDELAMDHVITLTSTVKPYSRRLISSKLLEAAARMPQLSALQKKNLAFYLKEFRPEISGRKNHLPDSLPGANRIFNYSPLSFSPANSFTLSPLLTEEFGVNENGNYNKTEAGAGFFGYAGKHFGYAFSIKKGFMSQQLAGPAMYTPEPGQKWNNYNGTGGDYVEWTGQLTYSWKWGSAGIMRERNEWGDNYHGANIFSDKPPPFFQVQLHIHPAKWLSFTWFHGWLSSNVVDSIRTFRDHNGNKTYYVPKFISANLLTVTPWRRLDVSFGNSVVYSDKEQVSYMIPILFYKSIDHTLYPIATSPGLVGDNAQMFFDISSRQIKHLHLYLALYVDELMVSRITNPKLHNFLSWKAGFDVSNFLIPNFNLVAEFTRTLPGTYQHPVATTTFENDGYNFGNYLRDNAQELYIAAGYKLLRGLSINASWKYAKRGDEFIYVFSENITSDPILKNIMWSDQAVNANVSYEFTANGKIFLAYQYSIAKGDVKYNPLVFHGTANTISCGFSVGL